MNTQSSGPKPPVFVRWLPFEWRLKLALKARDWGADLCEWIAPELKERDE